MSSQESNKRIVIAAGGTGGHLYPAQALAKQLIKHSASILFVAGGLEKNRYFDRHEFNFNQIPFSSLLSKNPLKVIKGIFYLLKGTKESLSILRRFKPDVVVGFGSYYSIPPLLAARYLKIPIILHEANSIPGLANQWLAPLSSCIALHFPFTASFFKKYSPILVGLPLREGYDVNAMKKEEALAYYNFSPHKKTVLICGGSQGAQTINKHLKTCLPTLSSLPFQIIHLTGRADPSLALQETYQSLGIQAIVKEFEPNMQFAWRAADAFVGRSGASTIAESLAFEVPGILIPYPHATKNHQECNADFLVNTVGCGWKILESELTDKRLLNLLINTFHPEYYEKFKIALRTYKNKSNAINLMDLVLNPKLQTIERCHGSK